MLDIGSIITSFGEGITSLLPLIAEAMYQTFMALFFTVAEGGAVTLNALGSVSIFFLVISACYKFLPTVIGWFKLKMKAAKRAKARKKA